MRCLASHVPCFQRSGTRTGYLHHRTPGLSKRCVWLGFGGLGACVCRSSSEVYGTCTGFLKGVPVSGILGDQQAALFGQACFSRGQAKCTYGTPSGRVCSWAATSALTRMVATHCRGTGTGGFLLCNTGTDIVQSQSGMLTTVAYKLGNEATVYGLEGSVAVCGSLIQWLRDNLGIIATAPEVESLARSVDDNGGVYVGWAQCTAGAARHSRLGCAMQLLRARVFRVVCSTVAQRRSRGALCCVALLHACLTCGLFGVPVVPVCVGVVHVLHGILHTHHLARPSPG